MENNLYAVPFDLDTLKVRGGQVSMIKDAGPWAISDEGTLVYVQKWPFQWPFLSGEITESPFTLVWVDKNGKEEPLTADPGFCAGLSISPDGTRVALEIGSALNGDIWILDLTRGNKTPLTFFKGLDLNPVWSPDSKMVFFNSSREEPGIYTKAANGTGEAERVFSLPGRYIRPSSISRDGKTLLFAERDDSTDEPAAAVPNWDISALPMEGERKRRVLLKETYAELIPKISPDGRYLAYASNESGQMEVYVRPFPDVDKDRWQVSTNGGESPRWSLDGRELYYITYPASIAKSTAGSMAKVVLEYLLPKVMAVKVETEPIFKPGKPEILFQGPYSTRRGWDIDPDGKRFLMIKPRIMAGSESASEIPRKISIVLNWFEELKERVPLD